VAAVGGEGLEQVKGLLLASARRHGVNPNLVMGVAWWESGWDQGQVSATGAIGIMQVEPATAASAGPLLLHRTADIRDPADNIELGTAVLKEDLDHFNNDLTKALVAYYAGPGAVTDWNDEDDGAKRYVWGVYRLAVAFSDGTGPV
jgi:soluble lytic murein transglycosylase-like protein